MAQDTQHRVTIRLTGNSPDAVEFIRMVIIGAMGERTISTQPTRKSTHRRYTGTGITYTTVTATQREIEIAGYSADESET